MQRPNEADIKSSRSKQPTSQVETAAENVGGLFFTVFERLCERLTSFVSGHWGTLTAIFLLIFGCVVFLRERDNSFAAGVERLMTMLSLALLFLLQRSQTKATLSIQVKLNEILKGMQETSNEVINVEHLSEEELAEVHEGYEQLHGRDAPAGEAPDARSRG